MSSKTGDNNDNMTGSKRRVFCEECVNLKRELSLQINAFETLAVLNPNLKSEILVQNLREVLSKIVDTPLNNDVGHVHELDIKTDSCLPPVIEGIIPDYSVQDQNQNLPQSSVQDENGKEESLFLNNENSLNSQISSVEKDLVTSSTSVLTQGTNERKRKLGVPGKRRKGKKFGRVKKRTCKQPAVSDDAEWDGLETRKSGRQVNKRVTYTNSLNELDHDDDVTIDERRERFIELPPTKSKLSIFKSYKTRKQQSTEQTNLQENSLQGGSLGESNHEQKMMEIGNEIPPIVLSHLRVESFTKNNNWNDFSTYIKTILVETGCSSYNIYQCTICEKEMTIWRNSCLHVQRVHFKYNQRKPKIDGYSYYKSPFNVHSDPNCSTTTTTTTTTTATTINHDISNGIVSVWSSPDDTNDLTVLNPFPNFDLKKTLSAHIVVKMLKASRIPQRPLMLPHSILNVGIKRRNKTGTKRRRGKGKFTTRKSHSENNTSRIYKNTKNTKNTKNINTITTNTIYKDNTNTNIKIKKPRKISLKKMKQQQQQLLLDQPLQPQKITQHRQQHQQPLKQVQHRRKRKPQKIVRVNQHELSTINGLNPGAGYTKMDDYIDPNNPPVFARKSKSGNPPPFIPSPPSEWNSFTSPNNNVIITATTTTTSISPTGESIPVFPPPPCNSITGIDRDNWNDLEMNAEDVISLNNNFSGNTNNTNDSIYNTFAPFLPPPSIMPVHQDHDHLHVSAQSQVSMEFANEVQIHSPLLPSILPYPPMPYTASPNDGYQADSTSMSLHKNGLVQSELDPFQPHRSNNNFLQDPLKTLESDDSEKEIVEQDPLKNEKIEDESTEEEEEEEEYQEEEDYYEELQAQGLPQQRVNLSKLASQKGKLFSRPSKKKAAIEDVHKQIRIHSKTCFECMACNREFKMLNLARNHYRRIHLREHEVICLKCGKKSTNLGSFKWHVKACTQFSSDYIIGN